MTPNTEKAKAAAGAILIALVLLLGSAMDGPDDIEAAQDVADDLRSAASAVENF